MDGRTDDGKFELQEGQVSLHLLEQVKDKEDWGDSPTRCGSVVHHCGSGSGPDHLSRHHINPVRDPWGFRSEVSGGLDGQLPIVFSQYTSITLSFQIVFNGGWPSMSLYIEKGLMSTSLVSTKGGKGNHFFFQVVRGQESKAQHADGGQTLPNLLSPCSVVDIQG